MIEQSTEQSVKPSPGPYKIWCEDEQVEGVPCIEIGRGTIPSPGAKSLCLVQSTLDPKTDKFALTVEDWANAKLFAASWETAAERDRLVALNEKLVTVLETVRHIIGMPNDHTIGDVWRVQKMIDAVLSEARQPPVHRSLKAEGG